ncbi:general secretion pathway protein B [Aromatoleum tolulyticum]|uniref:General secretion pathway protein B n=1 Tax=Aromatoleum tolulyticum TaxID=34027 RepID=A0A1N7CFT9_9RHOO|nr:general secretion pathway protein GspB [Aromatoleum tolulyticum]SIR62462.1 general secretion pathway protein B [Aromatoleum tolulyticum]
MSYILEALQKSEHARHRGKVPDLSTLPETTPNATGHAATPRPPYLAAGFALALAAAILGWWRPWQAAAPHPAAPAPVAKAAETPQRTTWAQPMPQPAPPPQAIQEVPAGPSQSTAASALAEPAAPLAVAPQPAPPPVPLAAAAPASQPALAPLAPVRPPAAAPETMKTAAPVSTTRREPQASEIQTQAAVGTPVRRSESGSRKSAESAPPSPSPAPAATRIATASPAAPAPAAIRKRSDGRILSLHELPPAVRGILPRLDISGFAAAPDSGKRMVVINDRLVQEGEEVVPGVTLTSAEKDGVVLDFQGYRFRAQQ